MIATASRPAAPDLSRGDWMQTYAGKQFFPLDPRPEDICIEDIAHALSNLCRFGGHVSQFYSVAQHSVLVAGLLPARLALAGLLHDASEAYMVDVPRPLKVALAEYQKLEKRLQAIIARKFDVNFTHPFIKRADNILLMTEARDLLGPKPAGWGVPEEPAEWRVIPLEPGEAEDLFLRRFCELTEARE